MEVIRGRTSFIIAHRLNTIRDCDVLLVLKSGKLEGMVWREDAQRAEHDIAAHTLAM